MPPRRSGSWSTHPGRLADYDLTRGGQDKIRAVDAAHGRGAHDRRNGQRGWARRT